MIKLNKPVEMLEAILEKIEAKVDELQNKMDALEENACDHDRDMTDAEWNKWYKWEEKRDELQSEYDEIENALDYLRGYAD